MKSKNELLSMFFAVLAELKSKSEEPDSELKTKLQTQLELLWDILEEDVPEEYWDEIEELINL